MRKTFQIIFTFVLIFAWCGLMAQDHSTGAVPDIAPHTGNYSGQNEDGGVAYGWGSIIGQFLTQPIPGAGPFTNIAPMAAPGFLSSACFGPTGILYFTDTSTDQLYTVDTGTGALTLVGSTTGAALNGICYDWSSGTFYGVGAENLYTVDVSTGATTLVGNLGFPGALFIDIAIDCNGNAYAYDLVSDSFYGVNLGTGAATLIGPLGFDANFGQGLGYDYSSGILYMSAFNNTTFTGQLREVNVGTGGSTLVWDYGFEQVAPFAPDAYMCAPVGGCTFFDDFEGGTGNWTITNDGGTCVWVAHDVTTNSYTISGGSGNVLAADADLCGSGSTTLTTATLTNPVDATLAVSVVLMFDNDWRTISSSDEAHVEVSTDGGSSWSSVVSWVGIDQRDTFESHDITGMVAGSMFQVRFRTIQPGWDWWWVVDNVCIEAIVPVELVSFAASVNETNVTLSWGTATETNNQGFSVERNSGSGFEAVGFVQGNGTSTEMHHYTFVDENVAEGNYTYRLKQMDYDGTFEYSSEVSVEVTVPDVYSLAQNYPNPFNPSTKINFSLAVDSKVSMKIFDVLGQEVKSLINNDLAAGSHQIDFNAAGLNSGIYFYRIEATGSDGTNFVEVKKMTLLK